VTKSKKVLFSSLAVAFGLVVGALAGEAALRLAGYSPVYYNPLHSFHEAHPLVGYRGKPDFVGRFRRLDFDVTIAHRENGFRRHEYENRAPNARRRILVFGDSFTWGWGVGQGKVFTDLMNQLMPDYQVMNFGLNATGTVEQFTLFEAYGRELLRPGDTVVLMFNNNDFSDNLEGFVRAEVKDGQVRRVGPKRHLPEALLQLKHISYFVNFVIYSADVLKETRKRSRAEKRAVKLLTMGEDTPEVVVAKHFLKEFESAVENKNGSFVVAYIPGQGELGESLSPSEEGNKNEQALRQTFFACAEAVGIPTIDLLPHFLEGRKSGRYDWFTFRHDAHWNENGHAVAAKVISDFIFAAAKG
jgi:lysophospholipase L1-like esterase